MLGNPVVALALGLLLFSTTAGARSTDTRAEDPLIGSEGDAVSASASGTTISPVTLPIEVLGPDGYTASVTVDVPSPGEVSKLYLQLHSPAYRDASVNPGRGPKASVRLNGGPWMGITNGNVDVFDHEAEYGGLNGSYHTIRMTIPISALGTPQSGANTLRFRFNGTDGHTSGYRVIDLNFLRSGGSEILPASAFTEDNPSLWAPISDNPSYLADGEDLWESAQLVDRPNGPSIQASCSDCHANDGRDLWYFAYSNHSIVERSKFHGLSQEEGEKIASYIRSLQDSDETYTYEPPGRPWNPPFQPGPGLDLLPAYAWSAGAGVDAVLENDSDMIEYAFGGTIEPSDLDYSDPTLPAFNRINLPLAIQFPDWNEWLPDVHPKDLQGNFLGSDAYAAYVDGRAALEANGVNADLHGIFTSFGAAKQWTQDNAPPQNQEEAFQEHRRNTLQWGAVKMWELHREFDLEDEGSREYGASAEARTWFSGTRLPFDLAPHISGKSDRLWFQTRAVGKYFSTVWYEMQVVVNAGNVDITKGIAPVDWNYQPPHIAGLAKHTGPKHALRMLLTFAKLYQLRWDYNDNQLPYAFSVDWSQEMPLRYFKTTLTSKHAFEGSDPDDATLALLYEAVISGFMDKLDSIPIGDWPRASDCDNGNLLEADLPCIDWDYNGNFTNFGGGTKDWAKAWWHGTREYRDFGVNQALINRMADWGEAMWPSGNWSTLRGDVPPDDDPPSDDSQDVQLQLQGGWNTVAIPVAPENTDIAEIVGDVPGLTMVKDIGGGVFLPAHGIQTLSVWDPTKAYKVLVSNDATLQVSGPVLEPSQTPIQLEEGWNLLPYFLESPQSVEVALAPILDNVQYMTDEEDGIYDPSSGTNTIGLLQPGRGYLIHLTQASTFTYPSN